MAGITGIAMYLGVAWVDRQTEADTIKTKALAKENAKVIQHAREQPKDVEDWKPLGDGSSNSGQGTFLGRSRTGYELRLGSDNCIYVKDLREADLNRLGINLSQFRDAVKLESGKRCVFFE